LGAAPGGQERDGRQGAEAAFDVGEPSAPLFRGELALSEFAQQPCELVSDLSDAREDLGAPLAIAFAVHGFPL
jgi:hypothetical protein